MRKNKFILQSTKLKSFLSVLFLGGSLKKTKKLCTVAKKADLIVAADSGAVNALKLGVVPHSIIGDLDSVPQKILRKLKTTKIIRYPFKKDTSDGYLALKFILSQKPKEVLIFGTIGGRPDHSFSALSLLTHIPPHISAKMISHDFEIFFVRKNLKIHGKKGDIVSLLPLSISGAKVKTQGLLYALKNERLCYGSHGLSNEMTGKKASIQVSQGALFVFHSYC